jgi:arabinofuranan 3-O-arabinosyltransferase
VIVLPQNYNAGWEATIGEKTLSPQRVDGWEQGWVIGPGQPADVNFRYGPAAAFTAALLAGALGVLVCLVGVLLPARGRRDLPALATGRVGALDVVVVAVAGALLAGPLGVATFVLAGVLGLSTRRRPVEWGLAAALAMIGVGLGLSWHVVNDASWAVEWRQGWSLAAVGFVVAGLAAGRRAPGSEPVDGDDAEVAQADGR